MVGARDLTQASGSRGYPYRSLGIALVTLAALYPILGLGHLGLTIWTVAFWGVLAASIHATSRRSRARIVARGLGGLAVAASVAGFLCFMALPAPHAWISLAVYVVTLVFLLFAAATVLCEVLVADRVSVDHLVGAATGYVLLGLAFTYAFLVLEAATGGPILLGAGEVCDRIGTVSSVRLADHLYYSFVTLTTLGFGDLTPGTLAARVLTGAEAIAGQLFLTVLIARLIGLHVVQATRDAALRGRS